jgi:hypothetical protein
MDDANGNLAIDLGSDRDRESGVAIEVVRCAVDWVDNPADTR